MVPLDFPTGGESPAVIERPDALPDAHLALFRAFRDLLAEIDRNERMNGVRRELFVKARLIRFRRPGQQSFMHVQSTIYPYFFKIFFALSE